MVIIEYNQRNKKFADIQNGEVFKLRGEFYMKIYCCPDRNAVLLSDGFAVIFDDDEYVTSCDCAQLKINEGEDEEIELEF